MEGKPPANINLLRMGLVVEGGLFGLALLLGWLGFFDHRQPLDQLDWGGWKQALLLGTLATLPMLVYLWVFVSWTPTCLQPMKQFVDANLKPMFREASVVELLVLSLMAGFGEELFFRWCLQGGITAFLESQIGVSGAMISGVVIASVVFGGCHWVNASYGVTTIFVGSYLGVLMIATENWLVPAIAHALFDFVALLQITQSRPQSGMNDQNGSNAS